MSSEHQERYFFSDQGVAIDPVSGERPRKLKYHAGGQWKVSQSQTYMPCYNPSTGAVIALAPQCSSDEVEEAVQAAVKAFPAWSATPVSKRVQVLYKMKALLDEHLEELTVLLAQEMGKKYQEAMGDVLKVTEVVEFACGAPHLMKGEALMQVSSGYDTTLYREPLGVFAGIPPWNFPAMIPHGWMTPICIATGNCMVLKAASFVPQSAMRIMELWQEAGIPDGVINLVTAGRDQAELLLRHPDIKGITFVGSTKVGLAHLRHRRVPRQAGAGPVRGQEPRPGAQGLQAGAHRQRHHERLHRLRRRALHGPAGDRGGEGHRRPVGGALEAAGL